MAANDLRTRPETARSHARLRRLAVAGLSVVVAVGAVSPAAWAQNYGPLGSSPKVMLPRTITEAGGEFQLDEVETEMTVFPHAERFEARARLQCTGTRGNVRLAMFILNGGRRATQVLENGQELAFSHAGDFLVVRLPRPMGVGQRRQFDLRYTGKAHSVSSQWVRDYRIDKYDVSMRVLPQTGNLTAVANLTLLGMGRQSPPKPQPSRWPGVPKVPHWRPPMLDERDEPKLGLVLNNHFAVDRLLVANQNGDYTHAGGVVSVKLGAPLQQGEVLPVTMFYTGKIRNADRNRIWDNFDNDVRPSNPWGAE